MNIAMLGQPNCGKSTIFNAVAGYKSLSSNFPGTTVQSTRSKIKLRGKVHTLVDFPGSYSLSSFYETDLAIRNHLFSGNYDVIINVIDASQLAQGLLLTLELMDLNIPIVISLNMMDEAARKGIAIDTDELADSLGIPVVPTIASKNSGVRELFMRLDNVVKHQKHLARKRLLCQNDIEQTIDQLTELIQEKNFATAIVSPRFIAIKLLENDEQTVRMVSEQNEDGLLKKAQQLQQQCAKARGKPAETVIALERNALAMDIFHRVSKIGHKNKDWREKVDDVIMHRFWGYVFLALILTGFFYFIFGVGAFLEEPLLQQFTRLESYLGQLLGVKSAIFAIVKGALYGISGGIAIVLPYLIPFLLVMTILEDIGYLPRVAYLMDSFMHRIGLHGTAILPAILGYGCSVPAVMATRILPSKRDKIIAAVIATLVPCSARSIVIFGLVGRYLGAGAALFIYVLNIFIIALTGKVLSTMMPEVSPGMILEIPKYQLPTLQAVVKKIWFRVREFIIIAWPLLILGSIILGMAEFWGWDQILNTIFSPLSWLLGLPKDVSTTLIFGILRKELSLIMLMQAMGTSEVLSVMTPVQVMTFTIFITFYIPCMATIAVLIKELGNRWTMIIIGITLVLAITLALLTRLGAGFIL